MERIKWDFGSTVEFTPENGSQYRVAFASYTLYVVLFYENFIQKKKTKPCDRVITEQLASERQGV